MNSNNNLPGCLRPSTESSDFKTANGATPSQLRVLLLEDDLELAELLSSIFEAWGFQPMVTHLGREASRLLEEHEFRLAFVDINLPDMTGFEVIAGAWPQGWVRNTKLIFSSGEPSEHRTAMARGFPGSVFVPKPFQMQNLLPLIQRLLRMN